MSAIYSGLRPGEIFCLKIGDIKENYIEIVRGVYRGKIDSPRTRRSERMAAIGDGTQATLRQWLEFLPDHRPTAWLFPSENRKTPLRKDNCWQRFIVPHLREVKLEWVNFQAMRRTFSTISDREGVSAKVRADQMGHGIGVNVDVYAQPDLQQRLRS
jgi:integrase